MDLPVIIGALDPGMNAGASRALGDMVRAVVPSKLKTSGSYIGKVAIRKTGSFDIQTTTSKIQGISYKYCRLIQRADGYSYTMLSK